MDINGVEHWTFYDPVAYGIASSIRSVSDFNPWKKIRCTLFPYFTKEIEIHSMFRYKNNYYFVSKEGISKCTWVEYPFSMIKQKTCLSYSHVSICTTRCTRLRGHPIPLKIWIYSRVDSSPFLLNCPVVLEWAKSIKINPAPVRTISYSSSWINIRQTNLVGDFQINFYQRPIKIKYIKKHHFSFKQIFTHSHIANLYRVCDSYVRVIYIKHELAKQLVRSSFRFIFISFRYL